MFCLQSVIIMIWCKHCFGKCICCGFLRKGKAELVITLLGHHFNPYILPFNPLLYANMISVTLKKGMSEALVVPQKPQWVKNVFLKGNYGQESNLRSQPEQGRSVWSLHVVPVSAWISSGCSGSPTAKNMQKRVLYGCSPH